MTGLRHRLDELSRRVEVTRWTSTSARAAARRRKHLVLIKAQCDALRQLLDEVGQTSAASDGWLSVRAEFDAALARLERSFERALARNAARPGDARHTAAAHAKVSVGRRVRSRVRDRASPDVVREYGTGAGR